MERVDEWRLFISVARLGSFSRAAKALGCSPQAATRAVAALEARTGVRLLHRTTRSVSLTNDGERYLDESRRALAAFDALESRAAPSAQLAGALSITAPLLFGQLHVAPLTRRFLRRHPAVELRLSLTDRVVSLAEEAIDLAFRIGPLPDSSLRARRFGEVRAVVCASPRYLELHGTPSSPRDLEGRDVVAFTHTTPVPARWSFAGPASRRLTVTVRPRLVVDDGRAAIAAAASGLGFVRALSYQVEALVARGKLRLVLEDHEGPRLPIHLVQPPGPSSRLASAFASFACEGRAPRP